MQNNTKEKQNIKDFNTTGMSIHDRENLFKSTKPIPEGIIVYKAGDAFEGTTVVKVTKTNQKEVSMFWNSLYFDNKRSADFVTCKAHADYNDYQGDCVILMSRFN